MPQTAILEGAADRHPRTKEHFADASVYGLDKAVNIPGTIFLAGQSVTEAELPAPVGHVKPVDPFSTDDEDYSKRRGRRAKAKSKQVNSSSSSKVRKDLK